MHIPSVFIDRLQTYIHGKINPEKGQTSRPLVSFLRNKSAQRPKIIRKAERYNHRNCTGAILVETSTQSGQYEIGTAVLRTTEE